jgi:hypothetical protein
MNIIAHVYKYFFFLKVGGGVGKQKITELKDDKSYLL